MANCKAQVETYSRVVGYYRPVQHWNKGKQAEFHDRVTFKIKSEPFCNMAAKKQTREDQTDDR